MKLQLKRDVDINDEAILLQLQNQNIQCEITP